MKFTVHIRYYHPSLEIGLEDIRNAWFLARDKEPVKLNCVVHRGSLAYRFPQSGRRVSYRFLKKGLIKKTLILRLPMPLLPF
jgi:hypothetical protein